jgi:probable HAF family extracellular repeat protein
MRNRNLLLSVCAILLTITSLALPAADPASVSHFKNINAPGAIETDTYAINDSGVIAGDFVDSSGVQHGMILNGTKLTSVDNANCVTTPGTGAIALFGISTTDTVVGWCTSTKTGDDIAFSYLEGKFVNIAFPGSTSTLAQGINDKGQIVGTYFDSSDVQHGFFLSGGKYMSLDVPSETASDAWAINNKGLITIFALNSGGTYDSWVRSKDGTFKKMDVPKEAQSLIHGIDSFGDLIYTVVDSSNNVHGAFYDRGAYTVFDDPKGVNATQAFGLNEKQLKIVGLYKPAAGSVAPTYQGYSVLGCCKPDNR